ncbi:SGNH hydrolase-type esterase domain-containing protein [Xylaria sp. CBS 124048]|nr:SGNH hydrolase-type esterase domain-containing protein [Xylaria sp. CBS 124048]
MSLPKENPNPGSRPFAWLRTKRAIAALTLLVVASVVLAVLGATTDLLTPHNHSSHTSQVSNGGASGNNGDTGNNNAVPVSNTNGDGVGVGGGGGDDNNNNNHHNITNTDSGDANHKNNTQGGNSHHSNPAQTNNNGPWRPQNSSTIADGTPLRIMCLGASIVKGERSTDYNGFRDTFRDDLAGLGAPVNMVGTQRRGDMIDNDHEAYGGNRVSQTHEHATHIVDHMRPNVFVINVGTNNVLQDLDVDVAGADMASLIDYLLSASPRSTVVLSTLLTNTVPNREPLILDINQQYRDIFKTKYEDKTPVVLAELHPSTGLPGRPQVSDIGPDGSHPTDEGYEIMGHILAEAVKEADLKGYLRWPEDNFLAYDGEKSRLDAPGAR